MSRDQDQLAEPPALCQRSLRRLIQEVDLQLPTEMPTYKSGSPSSTCAVVGTKEGLQKSTGKTEESSVRSSEPHVGSPDSSFRLYDLPLGSASSDPSTYLKPKKTSRAVLVEDIQKERERRKEDKLEHMKDLKLMLEDSDPRKAAFVILHISVIAEEPGVFTIPSEIGLTAFTVEDGIIDNYWSLIDHADIESGFAMMVYEMAEKKGLPIPPFDPRYQDYGRIISDVDAFVLKHLHPKSRTPKVYCLKKDILQMSVSSRLLYDKCNRDYPYQIQCLEQLVRCLSTVGYQGKWKLTVSDVEIPPREDPDLYKSASFEEEEVDEVVVPAWSEENWRGTSSKATYIALDEMALELLNSHAYAYISGLSCPYHHQLNDKLLECALNVTNRFAYNALAVLTENFGIRRYISLHSARQDYEHSENVRTQEFLSNWNIPYEPNDYLTYVTKNDLKLNAAQPREPPRY